jgi:putative membrane protein
MFEKIVLMLKGFCMGTADVIPGVSGGTMAFILGIYEQLLSAIKSFDLIWLKYLLTFNIKAAIQRPHFGFLIPLVFGIASAFLFFTQIIPLPTLLKTHAELIYGLFFGLIIGSIFALLKDSQYIDFKAIFSLIIGIILGGLIVTLVPTQTPDGLWFIFICGMLAIFAMLLPGISGSFILLILHKYDTMLTAISQFDWPLILTFSAGAGISLILFSRFFSWLLKHYHHTTLFVIIGMLIGSLWAIWPFQHRVYETVHNKEILIHSTPYMPTAFDETIMYTVLLCIVGLLIVLGLHILSHRMYHSENKGN